MWWKAEAVLKWISQHSRKGWLLWIEADLEDHCQDVAPAVLNAAGQGLELPPISTKGAGLIDEHLRRILAAARS